MKKCVCIILFTFILFIIGLSYNNYLSNNYKNIDYVAEAYLTSGFFNDYKLYSIESMQLSFSDGTTAVMYVKGIQDKSPHKDVTYKLFLEKNSKNHWKVKKLYPTP